MKIHELEGLFEKHSDEYLKFGRVSPKLSPRPDIHAFILIHAIAPGDSAIVGSAEHDKIWLNVSAEEVAEKITEEQIVALIRCGVRWDSSIECFAMFV